MTIIPVEGRFQEARLTAVNHDMTLSGWSTDSNDPDSFFRPLLSCAAIGSQTNYTRWCDPVFDSLLHRALFSQQLASRIEAYRDIQQMLAQQQHQPAQDKDYHGVCSCSSSRYTQAKEALPNGLITKLRMP